MADDLFVCLLADLIQVLFLRRGGRLEQVLRLTSGCRSGASRIWLAADAVAPCGEFDRLLSDTSAACRLVPRPPQPCTWHISKRASERSPSGWQEFVREPYLVHWTRPRIGPWPDQSEDQFLDEFLWLKPGTAREAFDVLARIVRERCLRASGSIIRGAPPVVCFSEIPLEQLSSRTVFRTHRQRWDCLPYGMAIHRRWLEERGARPVRYGDQRQGLHLSPEERAFFQPATDRTGRVDWTQEREWRLVGDCSLEELPRESGLVFVATPTEARAMSYFSRWPVIAVGQSADGSAIGRPSTTPLELHR
ncbi:MAG: hypothetical protein KatS3mg110_0312 [Pirellulaceae bacterium]|nr:MAG: hypothetical protein KatS3mg110_0312 [Pirellulaceae bacterium]